MSLFAIADLHLSTLDTTNKSMEVFGPKWSNYTSRLEEAWRNIVTDNDTVVIAGDISWALTLEEAESDLRFIHELPGQKILLKGNHDFWWSTNSKLKAFIEKHNFNSLHFLHNNAFVVGQHLIFGTRSWYHDKDAEGAKLANASYEKIVARECVRLALSIEEAKKLQKESAVQLFPVCFLHFPPSWGDKSCEPILELLQNHNVKNCYFGHIHGAAPAQFNINDAVFKLIAADALGFVPSLIDLTQTTHHELA